MASTSNNLQDPNLSEAEQDAIIGAFVRGQENEHLRQRWELVLKDEHGVSKQLEPKRGSVRVLPEVRHQRRRCPQRLGV